MYHPNTTNAAIIIQITFPSGPVFGTAGITVLFAVGSTVAAAGAAVDSHSIVNLISSHPSPGIIQIFWSHSHCLV
jgi:hypothetical protein